MGARGQECFTTFLNLTADALGLRGEIGLDTNDFTGLLYISKIFACSFSQADLPPHEPGVEPRAELLFRLTV